MILETKNLRLRPLTIDDVAWVKDLLSDPAISAELPAVGYPVTEKDAEEWVRGALKDITFAIERPADGSIGGVIALHLEEGNRGQVGGWCGEPFRKNGYAEESLHAIVRYGYEELGLSAVYMFRKGKLWIAERDADDRRIPFRYQPDGWDTMGADTAPRGFVGRLAAAIGRRRS